MAATTSKPEHEVAHQEKTPQPTADNYDLREWVECYACCGEGDVVDDDELFSLGWIVCDICNGKGGGHLDDNE